jgi:serine phosphatase RsbU (regulator of sigma subunit)
VRFLRRGKPVETLLVLARVWVRGEPDPLIVAAAMSRGETAPLVEQAPPADEADSARDETVAALVHRTDILTRATELLLEDRSFTESVAVRRCARLLADELADWVIVDLCDDEGTLRRNMVIGPPGDATATFARVLQDIDPRPDTMPAKVHRGGQPALLPDIDDLGVLGTAEADVPVCALMNATSVLSVPLSDGEAALGALTVVTTGDHGQFDLIDLGLVQRVGHLLALEIRADRIYRRGAEVANALQASLLPRELPKIDGLETGARYLGATRGVDVGGDFYDVFPTPGGWGLVLGDVCGKGEEAAAVTATARQGVRLLSRWDAAPASVLPKVNEALLDDHDRFVTAVMASVRWHDAKLRVELGSAGHQPAIVIRRDGTIRTSAGGGMPLGLFDDLTPGTEVLDLEPGDTLFLHSDGVLDACDAEQRPFGMERLIETLATRADRAVSELVTGVERAVIDFCDGDLRDDVSILALRVLEPSSV